MCLTLSTVLFIKGTQRSVSISGTKLVLMSFLALNIESVSFEFTFAGSGAYDLEKERQKVLSSGGDDPDFVTKKNIMEMMDTTIWTYLSSFWTDPAKVNSNETDSIFSARKLMRTSFVPEIESDLWVPFMNRTVDNVKHIDNFQEAIILCDPESMFYLKQKLEK